METRAQQIADWALTGVMLLTVLVCIWGVAHIGGALLGFALNKAKDRQEEERTNGRT